MGAPGAWKARRKEGGERPDPRGLMGLVTNQRFFPKSREKALTASNLNGRHDSGGFSRTISCSPEGIVSAEGVAGCNPQLERCPEAPLEDLLAPRVYVEPGHSLLVSFPHSGVKSQTQHSLGGRAPAGARLCLSSVLGKQGQL